MTAKPVSSSFRVSSGPSSPAVPRPHCHQVRNASRSAAGMVTRPARLDTVRPPIGPVAQRTGEVLTWEHRGEVGQLVGGSELTQRTDRRRALGGAGERSQGRRERGGVGVAEHVDQTSADHVQILGEVGRIGQVDAERKRCPRVRIVGQGPQSQLDELLGQSVPRPAVHAEGEVGAHSAEGRRRMQEAAREIERVTGPQHRVDDRFLSRAPLDRTAPVGPGLMAQRGRVDGLVDDPALLARDLQHEHVVDVVVVAEALVLRRGHVRVRLHRVPEVGGQPLAEGHHRRPHPVQCLQHHRRAVGEQPDQRVVADLVTDRRADTTRGGEGRVAEGRPVPSDPEEGSTQPALGHQLVHRVGIEEIAEAGAADSGPGRGQQCSPTPVVTGELLDADRDQASERRLLGAKRFRLRRHRPRRLRRHRPRRPRRHRGHRTATGAAIGRSLRPAVGAAVRAAVGPPSWTPDTPLAPPSAGPSAPLSAPPSAPPSWTPDTPLAPPSAGPSAPLSAPPSAPPSCMPGMPSAPPSAGPSRSSVPSPRP